MNAIAVALRQVSIEDACRMIGMDETGGNKLHCPFGEFEHDDMGAATAFRVYDDGHAFCFACWKRWDAVGLCAQQWECTRGEAALQMCKLAGVSVEEDWRDKWTALMQPGPVDTGSLGEALKRYCARIAGPAWQALQFEPAVRAAFADYIGLLSMVTTDADVQLWLGGAKHGMRCVIAERGGELGGEGRVPVPGGLDHGESRG